MVQLLGECIVCNKFIIKPESTPMKLWFIAHKTIAQEAVFTIKNKPICDSCLCLIRKG